MNYNDFREIFSPHSVIDIRNVSTFFNGIDGRRLYEWQKKDYIRKITNGFYIFTESEIDDALLMNIASQIYQPSYVALESALSFYNFIPEAVFQTVSITTKRNKVLNTQAGDFTYRSIKRKYFFGYKAVTIKNRIFFVSDPEKALLDMFYFQPASDRKHVLKELRLNLQEISSVLNRDRMEDYLKVFSSPKLYGAFQNLKELLDDQF